MRLKLWAMVVDANAEKGWQLGLSIAGQSKAAMLVIRNRQKKQRQNRRQNQQLCEEKALSLANVLTETH